MISFVWLLQSFNVYRSNRQQVGRFDDYDLSAPSNLVSVEMETESPIQEHYVAQVWPPSYCIWYNMESDKFEVNKMCIRC